MRRTIPWSVVQAAMTEITPLRVAQGDAVAMERLIAILRASAAPPTRRERLAAWWYRQRHRGRRSPVAGSETAQLTDAMRTMVLDRFMADQATSPDGLHIRFRD